MGIMKSVVLLPDLFIYFYIPRFSRRKWSAAASTDFNADPDSGVYNFNPSSWLFL